MDDVVFAADTAANENDSKDKKAHVTDITIEESTVFGIPVQQVSLGVNFVILVAVGYLVYHHMKSNSEPPEITNVPG